MHAYTEISIAIIALVFAMAVFFALRKFSNDSDESNEEVHRDPELGALSELYQDEIIAVRKKTAAANQSRPLTLKSIALYIMAPEGKPFLGYDVLQTLLSCGFKFGEMDIFHLSENGSDSQRVLLSLAQAFEPGTFDLDNMGSESYRGLSIFMSTSGNEKRDIERFNLLVQIARRITNALEGELLDDKKRPLSDVLLKHYCDNVVYTLQKQAVA